MMRRSRRFGGLHLRFGLLRKAAFGAVFCFIAAGIAHAAETDLSGKWTGTYRCGDSGDLAIELTNEQGVLTFDGPNMRGSLKVKARASDGGRVAFLPVAWVGQTQQGAMVTLIGSLGGDGNSIAGAISGCSGGSAFSLTRAAAPEKTEKADNLLQPGPLSGGPAQGHWKGMLSCKWHGKPQSIPAEADIVQDGNGVAALFHLRIYKTPEADAGETLDETLPLRGTLADEALNLGQPVYLDRQTTW